MIIFDIPYAPLQPGRWSVEVSNGSHSEFKSRQDALQFAVHAALTAQPENDALINVEGVDGQWRLFDHQAKGIV